MFSISIVQKIIIYLLPLVFAITVHEASHAFVADKYGDNTAKVMGRLSLNPLRHIDPVGTILFPIIGIALGGFIFGWAKPIPINYAKLHDPKKNILWIALAGPVSNLAMALIWALVLKLSFSFDFYFGRPVSLMAQAGIAINISIMLINLIPILPLDGGRILFSLLPRNPALVYARIEPYGMFILILLLLIGAITYIIQPLYVSIVTFILSLIQ